MQAYSLEAERKVLGVLMLARADAPAVFADVRADDFGSPGNRTIFETMKRMHSEGTSIEIDTLKIALGQEDWEALGGDLLEMANGAVFARQAEDYSRTLVELAVKRQIADAAAMISRKASNGTPLPELLKALDKLHTRADSRLGGGRLETEEFGEDFAPIEVAYHSEPYLPKGKCVLFDADGGTGKSSGMVGLSAAFSNGYDPLSNRHIEPLKTLYLHKGEDSSEELETVYRANQGKPGMIRYHKRPLVLDESGVRKITREILEFGASLVVLDALFYFLQGVLEDTGVALDVAGVMERLNGMASRTGCTVVSIRHTTKGTVGKQASDLGMGSVQFRNSHRGQLVARYHPTTRGLVVVTDEKGSLLVPKGQPFGIRRKGLEIMFVRDIDNPFDGDTHLQSKVDEAKAFLRESCGGVWMKCERVEAMARKRGISVSGSLKRAKEEMKTAGLLEYMRERGVDAKYSMRVILPEGEDPFGDA